MIHWKMIIRLALTLAMIYGAYTETGIWTALCLLLILVAIELQVAALGPYLEDQLEQIEKEDEP